MSDELQNYPSQARAALITPQMHPTPQLTKDHMDRLNYLTNDYLVGIVTEVKQVSKFNYPIVSFKLYPIPRKANHKLGSVCESFESVLLGLLNDQQEPLFQRHVSLITRVVQAGNGNFKRGLKPSKMPFFGLKM